MTKRKNKKLIVATLLAVPAAVVVGTAGVQAADVTLESFTINNDFLTTGATFTTSTPTQHTASDVAGLETKIIEQMASYNKSFTITYVPGTETNYKSDVQAVFNKLKATQSEVNGINYIYLYGTFNNAKVEATKLDSGAGVTLKFSVNYFTNKNNEDALTSLVTQLTNSGDSAYLFKNGTTELQKAKAIHDYIVLNSEVSTTDHSAAGLASTKKGSAQAYSLLTYRLLKKAGLDARYVVGYTNGALHMWNAVKVDSSWYYLDTFFDDDRLDKKSSAISYRYFLTLSNGGRVAEFGINGINSVDWGAESDYGSFHEIVNPAQVGNFIYYADAERNGNIKKLDVLTNNSANVISSSEPKSGYGNMIYYAYTDSTSAVHEDLYFINHAQGSYLYRIDLSSNALVLMDNVGVESINLQYSKLTYKTLAGDTKEINLEAVNEFIDAKSTIVIDLITALKNATPPSKDDVVAARQAYYNLTLEQRGKVTNLADLETIETDLLNAISVDSHKSAVIAINAIDPLESNFYSLVQTAKSKYESITGVKTAVYNVDILNDALVLTTIVDEINREVEALSTLTGSDLFDNATRPNVINEIEALGIKYDNLLPSLKNAVDPSAKTFLNTYRTQLEELKNIVDDVKDLMNAINYNSDLFVELIKDLKPKYEALKISQKALLTTTEKNKIESAISTATTYENQAKAFADKIQAWPTDGSGGLIPTKTQLDAASKEYDSFNIIVKAYVDKLKGTGTYGNLNKIPEIFDDLVGFDTATLAVIKLIEAIDEKDVDNLMTKYQQAGAGYTDTLTSNQRTQIETAKLGYGTVVALGRLGEVKKYIEDAGLAVEDFEKAVKALDVVNSLPTDILAVVSKLNLLSPFAISLVKQETLDLFETFTVAIDAAEIDSEILTLSTTSPTAVDVKAVRDKYEKASNLVKGKVLNLNKLHEIEADPVIKDISALASPPSPTWVQIKAVRENFEKLYDDTKDYIKKKEISENILILNNLEKAEAKYIDGLIEGLGLSSLASDIKAIRDLYNSLTVGAQGEVNDENEQTLKEYEDKLIDPTQKAAAKTFDEKLATLVIAGTKLTDLKAIITQFNNLDPKTQGYVKDTVKLQAIRDAITAQETDIVKAKEEADPVNKMIAGLNDRSSIEDIKKVQEAYGNLSEAGKLQITEANKTKLDGLINALKEKEDEEAALAVKNQINAVNDNSPLAEIQKVKEAYEALSPEAKALVGDSYVKKLNQLLESKGKEDKELNDAAKAEAKVVSDRIAKITALTATKDLQSIRRAYEALSKLAKTFITAEELASLKNFEDYQVYQETVVKAAKNQASAFDTYMADLTRNSTTAEIAKARAFYNNLSAEAKKHSKTLEKLIKLETMWSDPDYIDLYLNYYPHYTDQQPTGGIEITAPKPDPLFIPDTVATTNAGPGEIAMDYRDGNYTATVFATDAPGSTKSKLTLTSSNNVKVSLPKKDILALKKLPVTVSTAVGYKSVTISFTEGYTAKTFSDFVEIKVPISELGANSKSVILCKLPNGQYEKASYQVLDGAFVIKTKVGATFVVEDKSTTAPTTTASTGYKDINSSANSTYINELAKLGIVSGGTASNYYPSQNITRGDFAIMIARAANLTTSTTTSLTDVRNTANASLIEALNESGIMRGTTSTRFSMSGTITREEASVILARLFRHLKMDVATMQNEQQSNYRDIANLSYESRRSIALMDLLEIFDSSATAFKPTAKLTRGEFAKVLSKAMEAAELK